MTSTFIVLNLIWTKYCQWTWYVFLKSPNKQANVRKRSM